MAVDVRFDYALADFISFRDREACERVRRISRAELTNHSNAEFRIRIVDDPGEFYFRFAEDIVARIREAAEEGRTFVGIFPVGPMPQYANEDGETPPPSWPGSFQRAMMAHFFGAIDADLRPREENIHFPTREKIGDYSAMIEGLGGADVCYGGIGWCGHIAFWESHLGQEFEGDLKAYKQAGAPLVELHPMTIMQNALHSFGGDWSWVPPEANTIGPREILGAKHRSFWLDGDIGGGVSWQRFIARLVSQGPVSTYVPGSILQTAPTDYTILGGVADDVEIHMS